LSVVQLLLLFIISIQPLG